MAEILFCNQCGMANAPGAVFCSSCGASMNPAAAGAPAAGSPPATQPPGYAPNPLNLPVAARVRYAGFWVRVVAAIVDGVVVRIVVTPIGLMFGGMSWLAGMGGGVPHLGMMFLGTGITLVLLVAGAWLYEAFLESSSYQATLGKMIFGLKVTDLQGNRISFARATGRHFGKIVSGLILGIGFIMAGLTERKQALHDMLAGTLVRWP